MFRKKLVVAGMAAAMTVATGMTAYAGAGTIADAKMVKTADSVGEKVVKTIDSASARVIKTVNKQNDDQQATKDDNVEIDKEFGQDADNTQNSDKDGNKADKDDNKKIPGEAKEQPERKSDEEAMKEGNPTPDLPEGVTAEKPDDLPEGTDQKPAGEDGQVPSGDNTQTPGEAG